MNYFSRALIFFQKKSLRIEKRIRFVIGALILTFVMLLSTFFLFENGLFFVPILIIFVYVLGYFALLEGIEKIEWLTLFLMPVLLTIASYLFYFLFPVRWLTRVPFVFLYGISIYAVLLCSNIFNVGVEKSLQLYRAAFSINILYQMLISFLLFNIILSFKLNFFFNGIGVGIVSFLLALQLIWSVRLNLSIERMILLFSFFIALILGELALIGSFVPVKPAILSLFLTSSYYCISGLIYSFLDQRLFKETIREYIAVWIVVFILSVLSISW
ncbi:hypothetical protein A2866_02210 [Candidatus Roizmanbacteria bacterium RIFCSPHIGHO2_01_FULL_39_8]|uniref:Uncharacterized protein n=3 Tax=Candidatus Roizmaniibacteriota TaxID=1752723 RepID=A0A1F7GFT8_9BACT|nr:MAG: hypothetical protein A2866_02210 [Candidatus Roizmanbacteria bacterium RIFCSPHIGHO2_01_FULL_39_8]OGK25375.1 MAG: hypothetical protein A3C28_01325 [Candidatus Roizmanbacteria bacterium RIFCSPHIGHO2_02_FULL_39_9]